MKEMIGNGIWQLLLFAAYKYYLITGSGAFKFKSKLVNYLVWAAEFVLTLAISNALGEFNYIYLINIVVLSIIIYIATCYEQKRYLDHLPFAEYNRKPDLFLCSSFNLAIVLSFFFLGAKIDVAFHLIVLTYIPSTVSYIASLVQKGIQPAHR